MRYADLVTMYFERSVAIQNLWTLYVVVIGGLLAVASMRRRADVPAGILATVLYLVFAARNLGGLADATDQRLAVLDAIHRYAATGEEAAPVAVARSTVEPTLAPPSYAAGRNVHVGCDAFTVLTLWALQYRRWRSRDPMAAAD